MIVANQKVTVKWNNANRKHYESNGYLFTKNGDEFESNIEHITKGCKSHVQLECDWCKEKIDREFSIAQRNHHHFCSNKCQHDYRSYFAELNKPMKICEQCGEDYKVEKYNLETSRFCSYACLSKWQSDAFKGNRSSNYVERISVHCDWCNEEIMRTPSYIEGRTYNFCNMECKRNWHREVFVKSEEFLDISRKTMLNNLTTGKISLTNSKPQVIINDYLSKKGIRYTNEKNVGEFAFDVYLDDYDLYIEVNGGFWHCDNRFYEEINYDIQLNRIISDKRKRTYLKNKSKKNILYLWEFDIETNLELCSILIENFINCNGKLKNYHSFNFNIDQDGKINLENEIIVAYMDWHPEKIASIVNLEVRERVNNYQPDKHITFNCEYCREEKTQPITTYIRAKNHFCSVKCKNLSQQIGNDTNQLSFIHQCDNCRKNVELPNHRHLKILNGEQKNVFCSNECKSQWQSDNLIGNNNPNFTQIDKVCEYCSSSYTVPLNQKDRNRYCSVECRQKAQRNRITVKCLNCDTDVEKTPTDIKKNKSGEFFCSQDCNNVYKIKKSKEIRKCEYCDVDFETKKTSKQRFCCIACRNKGIALEKRSSK